MNADAVELSRYKVVFDTFDTFTRNAFTDEITGKTALGGGSASNTPRQVVLIITEAIDAIRSKYETGVRVPFHTTSPRTNIVAGTSTGTSFDGDVRGWYTGSRRSISPTFRAAVGSKRTGGMRQYNSNNFQQPQVHSPAHSSNFQFSPQSQHHSSSTTAQQYRTVRQLPVNTATHHLHASVPNIPTTNITTSTPFTSNTQPNSPHNTHHHLHHSNSSIHLNRKSPGSACIDNTYYSAGPGMSSPEIGATIGRSTGGMGTGYSHMGSGVGSTSNRFVRGSSHTPPPGFRGGAGGTVMPSGAPRKQADKRKPNLATNTTAATAAPGSGRTPTSAAPRGNSIPPEVRFTSAEPSDADRDVHTNHYTVGELTFGPSGFAVEAVDRCFDRRPNSHLLHDETGDIWSARLLSPDGQKFYILQIVITQQDASSPALMRTGRDDTPAAAGGHFCFTRWGLCGDVGTWLSVFCESETVARQRFQAKFTALTRNTWFGGVPMTLSKFKPTSGKYLLLPLHRWIGAATRKSMSGLTDQLDTANDSVAGKTVGSVPSDDEELSPTHVDRFFSERDSWHVYVQKSAPWTANLLMRNGVTKPRFFLMQVLQANNLRQYATFFRGGIVGSNGRITVEKSNDIFTARKTFEEKFREKTMNAWRGALSNTLSAFTSVSGKYVLMPYNKWLAEVRQLPGSQDANNVAPPIVRRLPRAPTAITAYNTVQPRNSRFSRTGTSRRVVSATNTGTGRHTNTARVQNSAFDVAVTIDGIVECHGLHVIMPGEVELPSYPIFTEVDRFLDTKDFYKVATNGVADGDDEHAASSSFLQCCLLACLKENRKRFVLLQVLEELSVTDPSYPHPPPSETGDEGLFVCHRRWGRVGTVGTFTSKRFATKQEAMKEFRERFLEKTGNEWKGDISSTLEAFNFHLNKFRIYGADTTTDIGKVIDVADDGPHAITSGVILSRCDGFTPPADSPATTATTNSATANAATGIATTVTAAPFGGAAPTITANNNTATTTSVPASAGTGIGLTNHTTTQERAATGTHTGESAPAPLKDNLSTVGEELVDDLGESKSARTATVAQQNTVKTVGATAGTAQKQQQQESPTPGVAKSVTGMKSKNSGGVLAARLEDEYLQQRAEVLARRTREKIAADKLRVATGRDEFGNLLQHTEPHQVQPTLANDAVDNGAVEKAADNKELESTGEDLPLSPDKFFKEKAHYEVFREEGRNWHAVLVCAQEDQRKDFGVLQCLQLKNDVNRPELSPFVVMVRVGTFGSPGTRLTKKCQSAFLAKKVFASWFESRTTFKWLGSLSATAASREDQSPPVAGVFSLLPVSEWPSIFGKSVRLLMPCDYSPDPIFKERAKYSVLASTEGHVHHTVMVSKENEKIRDFTIMQLLKYKLSEKDSEANANVFRETDAGTAGTDSKAYVVYMRSGPCGSAGNWAMKKFGTEAAALAAFLNFFISKTGNAWQGSVAATLAQFKPIDDMFVLLPPDLYHLTNQAVDIDSGEEIPHPPPPHVIPDADDGNATVDLLLSSANFAAESEQHVAQQRQLNVLSPSETNGRGSPAHSGLSESRIGSGTTSGMLRDEGRGRNTAPGAATANAAIRAAHVANDSRGSCMPPSLIPNEQNPYNSPRRGAKPQQDQLAGAVPLILPGLIPAMNKKLHSANPKNNPILDMDYTPNTPATNTTFKTTSPLNNTTTAESKIKQQNNNTPPTAIPTTVTATAEHRTRLRDAPRTGAPVHINNKHMPTSPNGEPTGTGTNTANTGTGTNGLPVSLSDLTGNKGTPTGVGMHKNIKSTVVATGKAPPAALGVGHTGSSIPALQPQKRQTKLNVVKPSLQHAAETKGQSTATGTTAPTTISASPPQVPNTATMTAVVSTVQPASPAAVSPAVGAAAVGDGAAVGGGGAAVGGAAVGGGGAAVGGAAVGGG
eukprot:Lankesteria_metandrocarpae@DN729_c0_g1_i1.p1